MAWTGHTFVVGAILTANQMNNLQADISSAFAKEASAPVLADSYVVTAMYNNSSITPVKFSDATVGNYIEGDYVYNLAASSSSTSYEKVAEFKIGRAGSYRIRAGGKEVVGGTNVNLRVYIDGVADGTPFGLNDSTWTWLNETSVVTTDQLVQLYMNSGGSGGEEADIVIAVMCLNPIVNGRLYTLVDDLNL